MTGQSRNPLKHVLKHIYVYPLSNSQFFAELRQVLLSQDKISTFVCATGNAPPLTKVKKTSSQTPEPFETDHTNQISPHFTEAVGKNYM